MEAAAKLISASGALVGAIAWPSLWAIVIFCFRRELRNIVSRVPAALDRLRKFKAPWVEGELDSLADKAAENGQITPDQTRAAARLAVNAKEFGSGSFLRELDELCLQYDTLRRTMPPSHQRTHEMTRIVAKMRALGPSTSHKMDLYKGSEAPGSRLAAIVMMQMEPDRADLAWLLDRFRMETPFLFYHAALALTNAANTRDGQEKRKVGDVASLALDTVLSFKGVPDQGTVEVLQSLVHGSTLPQ